MNNTQINNAKNIYVVMLIKYFRHEPALDATVDFTDFPDNNNNNVLLKFKTKTAGRTENNDSIYIKTKVSLNYLSNFWRTLEMILANFEINLLLI